MHYFITGQAGMPVFDLTGHSEKVYEMHIRTCSPDGNRSDYFSINFCFYWSKLAQRSMSVPKIPPRVLSGALKKSHGAEARGSPWSR